MSNVVEPSLVVTFVRSAFNGNASPSIVMTSSAPSGAASTTRVSVAIPSPASASVMVASLRAMLTAAPPSVNDTALFPSSAPPLALPTSRLTTGAKTAARAAPDIDNVSKAATIVATAVRRRARLDMGNGLQFSGQESTA